MAKLEIIDTIDVDLISTEDSGRAKIATLVGEEDNDDSALFVRFQSWDESKQHKEFAQFEGKRVKVTIETID